MSNGDLASKTVYAPVGRDRLGDDRNEDFLGIKVSHV